MIAMFTQHPEIAETCRKIVLAMTGTNDEISDEALHQVVGQKIGPGNSAMRAALRELQRADPPVHFRRLRKLGWKRMHDLDLVEHSEVDLKKIARGARRGRRRLNDVRFSELTKGDQLHAARNNTRFMAIEDAAATTKRKMPSVIPDLSIVLAKIKDEYA